MIEAHVAGLAGLRLPCLVCRERVAGVTGITGGGAKLAATMAQFRDLGSGFEPDLVAAATSFPPFNERHGLPMNRGHRFHCRPCHGVLSVLELLGLRLVTGSTSVGSGDLHLGNIGGGGMLGAVASLTSDFDATVLAELPIGDDVRCNFGVAVNAR